MKKIRPILFSCPFRAMFFIFAVAGLTLLLTGCATMDAREASRGGDELPWNSPASWESGSFGVPY